MGHEGDQPGLPGEFRAIMVKRLSPAEMNDLIVIQEGNLASDPDSFAFQLALDMTRKNWEKRFGMKRIPLSYEGVRPEDVEKLLGSSGLETLRKISGIINVAAVEGKWPLEALGVYRQIDPEIEDMKNVLVVLRLRTSFDEADKILKSFYPEIQNLADSLSDGDRSVCNRINFDIEPVVPPEQNKNLG